MLTLAAGNNTGRRAVRLATATLLFAITMRSLGCAEPVGISTSSDMVLLEKFLTTNPSPALLSSVKPLLATERGQRMLQTLRGSDRMAPRFNHVGRAPHFSCFRSSRTMERRIKTRQRMPAPSTLLRISCRV